jgi:lipopolysaccharide/colanic/teichoic acid biosynthesis glycosyltransferase
MTKRLFDLLFSAFFLVLLSPLLAGIAIWVSLDSPGGAFFRQVRVGKNQVPFRLLKFRTMKPLSEAAGQITVGAADSRITSCGKILRKYKLDELPQLFNILTGDMSVVGPRPEVPKYVNMYNEEQLRVLEVRPGLTDYASLEYFSENELLAQSSDPEATYINEIMPAKLRLNLRYISEQNMATDLNIIWRTVQAIFRA